MPLRRVRPALAALSALVAVAAIAGCGDGEAAPAQPLTVYAASSLRDALPALDDGARYDFGGSNKLQLQIERGAPADLFLSASPKEAQALYRAGRCERPVDLRHEPARARSCRRATRATCARSTRCAMAA